jgi:competence ComEA-like helix-hairpin-helix protein
MSISISKLARRASIGALAIVALVFAMGGSWSTRPAGAAPAAAAPTTTQPVTKPGGAAAEHPEELRGKPAKKELNGRLNLNTASEEQLMMLPSVGPSKAERIVVWRKKNGGFKRVADLRRVKGFGYRTFKRLEPFLDIKGDTTLVAKK